MTTKMAEIHKRAVQGHPEAQTDYGKFLIGIDGIMGERKDAKEGVEWLEKAVAQGNARAHWVLAWYDFTVFKILKEPNLDEAWRNVRKAAEGGIPEAQAKLAESLQGGSAADRAAAKKILLDLKKKGEEGDLDSAYWYARSFDIRERIDRLRPIAEKGHLDACNDLTMYKDFGVDTEKWAEKAAHLGDPRGMNRLVWRFARESNVEKVEYWRRRAAWEGDDRDWLQLSHILFREEEIRNIEEGIYWLELVAKESERNKFAVGLRYIQDVPDGKQKGIKYLRESVELGNTMGATTLARLYARDETISAKPSRMAHAYAWWSIARKVPHPRGYSEPPDAKETKAKMTDQEIKDGEKLVEQFMKEMEGKKTW